MSEACELYGEYRERGLDRLLQGGSFLDEGLSRINPRHHTRLRIGSPQVEHGCRTVHEVVLA
ncbi:hypothetical protein AB0B56_10470 [Streptosporangium canum]|uniref:hypothetical protein n=1 Tax=Streptosporangium canum TaxID=324952 RepID=UPI00342BABB9